MSRPRCKCFPRRNPYAAPWRHAAACPRHSVQPTLWEKIVGIAYLLLWGFWRH